MGYKILCIDDSKSVHAYIKECFQGKDVVLTSAFDGESGLAVLKSPAANPPFDLVLLDWEMPNLKGPQVFDVIATLPQKPPVIMLTSKNEISSISMMLEKGVVEYVMKPFTRDILLEKVKMVLTEL